MLAHRIIPVLLQRGHTLVKGRQFNAWRSVGHAMQAVRIYQARGVDELIYLEIGATPEGRGPDFKLVEQLTAECFMPLTVGGGVRTARPALGMMPRDIGHVIGRRTKRAVVAGEPVKWEVIA